MDDEQFLTFLEELIANPEHCCDLANQYMNGPFFDPVYHHSLVTRIKHLELAPATLNALLAYANDTLPTEGREWARALLSEAWKKRQTAH